MPDLDLLKQFQFLLAGFVAAWVFYGLTPYKRPTAFERVAQALVYTAIVQLTATGLAEILGFFGWEAATAILPGPASVFLLAVFLGVIFAWMTNRDYPHAWLRRVGLTMQTARKCNWADALDMDNYHFVILNLKDGRRIYGWPSFWPNTHEDDHFLLRLYAWLPDQKDGEILDMSKLALAKNAAILIASESVDTVELIFHTSPNPTTKGDSP